MTKSPSEDELRFLKRAVEIALGAERDGNLPIGALITLRGRIIAEGANSIVVPHFQPGDHAEIRALQGVSPHQWQYAREMTCFTTLEPCLMCLGSLVMHRIGRVVFGALDPQGGGGLLIKYLPRHYVDFEMVPDWIGPQMPEVCDPLFARAKALFEQVYKGRTDTVRQSTDSG